jgi:hypothetical protein
VSNFGGFEELFSMPGLWEAEAAAVSCCGGGQEEIDIPFWFLRRVGMMGEFATLFWMTYGPWKGFSIN